jgi:hypothetical protein
MLVTEKKLKFVAQCNCDEFCSGIWYLVVWYVPVHQTVSHKTMCGPFPYRSGNLISDVKGLIFSRDITRNSSGNGINMPVHSPLTRSDDGQRNYLRRWLELWVVFDSATVVVRLYKPLDSWNTVY